jgi:hypothetical protein
VGRQIAEREGLVDLNMEILGRVHLGRDDIICARNHLRHVALSVILRKVATEISLNCSSNLNVT